MLRTPKPLPRISAARAAAQAAEAAEETPAARPSTDSSTPAEVVSALKDASRALGKISYDGPMMNEIITTMKTCIDDALEKESKGTTITAEYVKKTYEDEIARVRSLYDDLCRPTRIVFSRILSSRWRR